MESFTAFKTIWDFLLLHPPGRVLSKRQWQMLSLLVVWHKCLYWGNTVYGMLARALSLSFSMKIHATSIYFPHLPTFPKTALEWNLYFILSLFCTMGTAEKCSPTQWQSKLPSPSSPKSLLVASFRTKKGCSCRYRWDPWVGKARYVPGRDVIDFQLVSMLAEGVNSLWIMLG